MSRPMTAAARRRATQDWVLELLQIRSEDYGNDHDPLCDCDQCMELMAMDWWPDDDEEGEE